MNFSIEAPEAPEAPAEQRATFTIEVDGEGKLTELFATLGGKEYDCNIQLTSRDNPAIVWCCTSEVCTSGPC